MNNLNQLYLSLSTSKNAIDFFTSNAEECYKLKVKPKMKFGRYQMENNQAIRLRYLLIPCYPLKSIQRQIYYQFKKRELPDCMFGSVVGSNNILNALQHIEGKYFLKIDLKDFFSNVTNKQVYDIYVNAGCSWKVARVLTKLTTHKGSLPQGAPSSPILANFAFANAAQQIQEFIKKYRITFTVFLDDLTFSSLTDFKHLIPSILAIIRANHFYPHHEKIHYCKNFCEITGLIVGNMQLKIVPEMEAESFTNPRVEAYVLAVRRHYQKYLEFKKRHKQKQL